MLRVDEPIRESLMRAGAGVLRALTRGVRAVAGVRRAIRERLGVAAPIWDWVAPLHRRFKWWRLDRSYAAALWWERRSAPLTAALQRIIGRVVGRLDRAQGWTRDRLLPVAHRIAQWLDERSRRASDRRERLAGMITRFRDMRIAPVVRAIEDRIPEGVTVAAGTAHELGLGRWGLALAVLCATAVLVNRWTRPAPSIPATEEELAMERSFFTGSPGDASAWIPSIGRPN